MKESIETQPKKARRRSSDKTVYYVVEAAMIAALYVVLTMIANMLNLAYGEMQFRISEVLCVLPVFTPAAIPGLTVGCILANIISPMGWMDMVFGSAATLLAALCSYALRKLTVKGLPVLSLLPPILFNAVFIGFEIWWFSDRVASAFFMGALWVGLGEAGVLFILGVPFFYAVRASGLFSRILPFHGERRTRPDAPSDGEEAAEDRKNA